MINYIEKKFNERVDHIFGIKPEIHKFISTHERKHICIRNLACELDKLENYKLKIDLIKLDALIRDYADLFCKVALSAKEAELLTDAELNRQKRENENLSEYIEQLSRDSDGIRVDELNSNIK